MTRIIENTEVGPLRIAKAEIDGDAVYVCRCGLSGSQPFCDGSHRRARSEPSGKLLLYRRTGEELVAQPVRVEPIGEPVA